MLTLNPRRAIIEIDNDLLTFIDLQRVFVWPKDVAPRLRSYLRGGSLAPALKAMLFERDILISPEPEPSIFPMREVRPGGWTNSSRGALLLDEHPGTLTVLDALSLDDIQALPRHGPLAYIGPRPFFTPESSSLDGFIPCARCLIIRHLSGQRACPQLYHALRAGVRIAFPPGALPKPWPNVSGVTLHGDTPTLIRSVLPLPDCPQCLAQSQVRQLEANPLAPVTSLTSDGLCHRATLPEMLWVAHEETVGYASSYDSNPERGRQRALHEALERYAAHFPPPNSPPQTIRFKGPEGYRHFSRRQALLTEPGSISTGLACRETLDLAIADGLAEVIERHALAWFWLGLYDGSARICQLDSTPELAAPPSFHLAFWILPSYDHPVVLCLAHDDDGHQVSGSACADLKTAQHKAYQECRQNLAYFQGLTTSNLSFNDPPETFGQHALAYWQAHYRVPDLTPFIIEHLDPSPLPYPVYHAELTPPDLCHLKLHIVRVLIPGLIAPPMAHDDWSSLLKSHNLPLRLLPKQPHPFA